MPDVYRDKLDIMETFSRYCLALDERGWDWMPSLYMPDVVAWHPEGHPPLHGPAAIVGLIGKALDWLGPTHHSVSNFIIDIAGDRAEARCLFRGHHQGARKHADKYEETLGHFAATLVRTPDGWKFSRFVEHMTIMLGTAEIFNPELAGG
jgi:SnoaL-like domain